jgi:iron complex transport system substrate-binding protein
VKFTSIDADGWYVPEAKAAMESGQILFGGKYSTPDYELILNNQTGLAIENGMIYHSPDVIEKLRAVGIPVLVEQSSYESHPLGRTEWIKLIGVLLGQEAAADQVFDAQAAQLQALAGQTDTGQTVAFFYISSTGYVVTRKSGDYVPKMIQLAGGDYVFKNLGDDTATSTVNLEMEQFYATAKDADYIIYNSTIGGELTSLNDLVTMNPLLKDFTAVQDDNVWCTDQDFYQNMTGLGQMITDMHQMLTDPDVPDQLTFLHRLR